MTTLAPEAAPAGLEPTLAPRPAGAGTVRVMTWNIHGAAGRNPRFDLDGVVALIRRWQPDVIALQEVDSRRKLTGGVNPFLMLQQSLGHHGMTAKSITTADGDYGQMLISCCPILDSEVRDISWPEREPRRAIKADIATPHGPLRVVATHLGLSMRERQNQASKLLELVGRCAMTTVLVGDFNDWIWVGSVRKVLNRELSGRTGYRTFPSLCPVLYLDRIYCRPRHALMRSFTDRKARAISDHLPVIADVAVI